MTETAPATCAYFDCFSGISGDMCLGALVDAGVPVPVIQEALGRLSLSGYSIESRRVSRAGLSATQVVVRLDEREHQPHRGLRDVLELIRAGSLPEAVTEWASRVFHLLAEAEARVHGTSADRVQFHEVGAVDAICDVVGTAAGLEWLGVREVLFSTVALGGGRVEAAHGALPVPAPATAELLRGVPTIGGPVDFELTTPTGAAILRALGRPSAHWPAMSVERIGLGAGSRDLPEWPNVLRLAVGTVPAGEATETDQVWEVECNLDDMPGERVAFCVERLLEAGSLDAFVTPIQMKKGRPGVQLSALCARDKLARVEQVLWHHSSTLGIRRHLCQRAKLRRSTERVMTRWGEVRVKVAFLGEERIRCKPEFEDCRRIAESEGLPLERVYDEVRAHFENLGSA